MSASSSENAAKSVAGQEGLVGSHVAATGPQTTHGHQVGRETGPPVYHATVMPAGSAPAESTFKPNNMSETPGQSADNYSGTEPGTETSAQDTMTGATSADVHTGIGHPGQGQSSSELRHDSKAHSGGGGLQGVGASGAGSASDDARNWVDMSEAGVGSDVDARSGVNK